MGWNLDPANDIGQSAKDIRRVLCSAEAQERYHSPHKESTSESDHASHDKTAPFVADTAREGNLGGFLEHAFRDANSPRQFAHPVQILGSSEEFRLVRLGYVTLMDVLPGADCKGGAATRLPPKVAQPAPIMRIGSSISRSPVAPSRSTKNATGAKARTESG